ncbi:hypothetical protein UCMB321_3089 [Pseudomonas batumici]|uniref:Uncharacterized protein n=1 Tax=Pseudomonas batumici TaxID=226910 RepID=A0A0C2EBB6_9PSED|nr:hypothetical protein UCMB321_3089 [Pseudomonas batumici]
MLIERFGLSRNKKLQDMHGSVLCVIANERTGFGQQVKT